MDRKEYKEKLIQFNSTDKYRHEMAYMAKIMNIRPFEKVLDFGAGLGTMSDYLRELTNAKIYAYDIHEDYYIGQNGYFKTEMYFHLDIIYFMHSIAHVDNPLETIIELRDKFLKTQGEMYFCTPNQDWIDKNKKHDYKPDPTAIKHFTRETMFDLLLNSNATEVEEFIPTYYIDSLDNERLYFMAKF